jgi:hypothetical protein
MSADSMDDVAYEGHFYKLPLDVAREADYFDKKKRKQIKADEGGESAYSGDSPDNKIFSGESTEEAEFEDMATLADVYLPRENRLVTLWKHTPLRDEEWYGPRSGPYLKLQMNKIPSCSVPLPPSSDWEPLSSLFNVLFRKLSRQGERQTNLILVPRQATADQTAINDASDGQAVVVENQPSGSTIELGGPSKVNLAFHDCQRVIPPAPDRLSLREFLDHPPGQDPVVLLLFDLLPRRDDRRIGILCLQPIAIAAMSTIARLAVARSTTPSAADTSAHEMVRTSPRRRIVVPTTIPPITAPTP